MPIAAGTTRDIPVRALRLCGLTWTGEFLWFSEATLNRIMAIDPTTGEIADTIDCPDVTTGLTTLGGNLVQVVGTERRLRVIDPESHDVVDEWDNPRPGHQLCGIEAGRDGVWMGYEDLRLVDLRSGDDLELLDTVQVPGRVAGITVNDTFVVYADHRAATLTLLDRLRRVPAASISINGHPTGITWDGTRIWYCDYTTLQLRAIEVPGILRA